MMQRAQSQWRRLARGLAVIGISALMVATGRQALAEEFKTGGISIAQPWSRATPGGATVGAGYLTITNGGDAADRLVSATAEVAGRAEIHQMSMTGGVMKMRPVPEGVELPANGTVALAPASYHLMLLGLKRPLKAGDTFAGTLTFERAGTVDVTFVVEAMGAKAGGG
jgi:copper(I)-binding protein